MNSFQNAERLIVAADFPPEAGHRASREVCLQVLRLAAQLGGSGVTLKVNSILRSRGLSLVEEIHTRGVRVFADLKLCDIPATLRTDAKLLREVQPEFVTVMCSAGVDAMRAVKDELPDTKVLGVTVLTSFTTADSVAVFGDSPQHAVTRLARMALEAGLDGLVAAPTEVKSIRALVGDRMTINVPGVRPAWTEVKGEDQNLDRVMTPADAIRAGADTIIVGRPIVQAEQPDMAAWRTIEEIASALK